MKLVWLSHLVPYPPKGGVLQRSYNLLRETSKKNSIFLIAFNQKALLPTELEMEEAVEALRKYCCGIRVLSLPSDKGLFSKYWLIGRSLVTDRSYTVNWNYTEGMKETVGSAIREFKPDVIHYDTIGMAEYFQPKKEIKQVLNHHNIESAMMLRRATNEKNMLRKFYFRQEARKIEQYEKNVCGKFYSNLTVSDQDGVTLKKIVGEIRTEIIPNGVDTSYFTFEDRKDDGETLIFAGGMNWYPNRDAMLYFGKNIWPYIKARRPSARVFIIGQNPPQKLLRMSGEDSKFIVTGFVDDVREYFRKASVYICPIRDGGGTRLKILDALAAGIPIVASSIAAEGINVTPGVDIIIKDKPEDFAEAVLKLLDDRDERGRLAFNGRRLVEATYSWEVIGKKLNNLYEELGKSSCAESAV